MSSVPKPGRRGLVLVLCAGSALGALNARTATATLFAHPAEPPEVTNVETEFDGGTLGLPGHEPGARRKPEMPDDEPSPTPSPEEREWFGGKSILEWSGLLGDIGGLRTEMGARGLSLAGSYTLDWSTVLSGGLSQRASTRHLLDVNLTLDLDACAGIEGATVYADFYSSDVNGGSRDIGDAMGYDVFDTGENLHQLAELWFEQVIGEGAVRVKVGKIDANTEFAYTPTGIDFIHSVGTFEPTTGLLPTYPNPALGACLFVYPCESFYAGFGVFDGSLSAGVNTGRVVGYHSLRRGDEIFYVGEAGFTWKELGEGLGEGRIAFGGHYNTGEAERFDGGTRAGTGGLFGLFEQQVSGTPATEDEDAKGAFLFLHAGLTDKELVIVHASVTAGLAFRGTFADRPDDVAGVLISHGVLSSEPGSGADGSETVVEVFYGIALTPWLMVKPDFQYIANPGGAGLDDAFVGAVQFRVSF